MIVSVLGLGYIGLPTAAVLASQKLTVVGVDVNQNTVDTINEGKVHIVEPGLDILVRNAIQNKYLKAVTTPEKADVFIIAVPTPLKSDNLADLSYIKSAAKLVASVLERGNLVILESTSPVKTTEKLVDWMRKDLGICLEEANLSKTSLPLTAIVDQFYKDIQKMGGGRWDTSSLIARLRKFD